MKGSKKIFTLLIFPLFSIAVAFTACPEPVGSLSDNSGPSPAPPPPDYIIAEPQQFIYNENDRFWPDHVKVYRIGSSGKRLIADSDNITINIEDANGTMDVPSTGLPLSRGNLNVAIKTVSISYRNMDTSYRIAVVDPGLGINDGGGTIIFIDW